MFVDVDKLMWFLKNIIIEGILFKKWRDFDLTAVTWAQEQTNYKLTNCSTNSEKYNQRKSFYGNSIAKVQRNKRSKKENITKKTQIE